MTKGRVALPLGFALLLVGFAAALARVSGFFTDDSYIHLVFARNLDRGEGFSFNAGEPVYGFTSPLWMLLLSVGHALVADWLALSRALGLLFTVLAVLATFRLARAAGGTTAAALAAAGSLALNAWFLRWSLSGMETSLAAFLVALGLERVIRGSRAVTGGLLVLALAVLARPETFLVFALAAAWTLTAGSRGSRAPALWGVVAGGATLAAWELWVHAGTGSWIPTAYTVKRVHDAVTLAGVGREAGYLFAVVGTADALLIVAACAALWRITRRRAAAERATDSGPRGALLLLLAWPAVLAAFFLIARVQFISRYWVPATPALCAVAWIGAERAFGHRARVGLGALYFCQQAAVLLFLIGPQIDAFARGLDRGPVEIGRWLRANASPDAVVATPDIGAIGFYAERRILDVGGLVTPAMAPILARHDLPEIMEGRLYEQVGRADYVVDRAARPGVLTDARHELVLSSRIENLGLSRPEPRYYSLYRVLPAQDARR